MAMWLNNLNGTIPFSLSVMPNLAYLELSFNSLSGTFPQSVSLLTALRFVADEVIDRACERSYIEELTFSPTLYCFYNCSRHLCTSVHFGLE